MTLSSKIESPEKHGELLHFIAAFWTTKFMNYAKIVGKTKK
jgi:hypothetical protein